MRFKVVITAALLGLLLTGACWANPEYYKDIIAKYGSVPDAILDPPAETEISNDEASLLESLFVLSGNRRQRARAQCYANQCVSMGAIEMYNMDNQTIYKTLIHSDLTDNNGMLVTAKHLKSSLIMPDPRCHLRSYGDLSEDGIVYCDYHGTLPDKRQELQAAAGYIKPDDGSIMEVFIILTLGFVVIIVMYNTRSKHRNKADSAKLIL